MTNLIRGIVWPLAGSAVLALGAAIGYTAKSVEADLKLANVEGLCRPSKSWTAHVSTDDSGYICFKEQVYTKRLIKYIIVERTE